MAKTGNIQQINPETGELSDVLLRLADYYPQNGMVVMANVHDGIIETGDIKIFPQKKDSIHSKNENLSYIPEELLEHGMRNLSIYKVYSKVFHFEDPKFSKDSYYKYWYNICRHLQKNTNIIISRKPTIHFINEIQEFENICDSSKYTNYRFIKECKNRGFIAEFRVANKRVFVAHPKYALSGNQIPEVLAQLFDNVIGNITDDGIVEDNNDE
ncbi:hypothetical protein LCGC14_1384250 [marine sediment metagenome]|uniref:Uncharacterized protein n=1 Tax=marine sediment metagenome TaxID=412755 RepID=A0A0F9K217_9ZZZZ